jgi:hypothetical protein
MIIFVASESKNCTDCQKHWDDQKFVRCCKSCGHIIGAASGLIRYQAYNHCHNCGRIPEPKEYVEIEDLISRKEYWELMEGPSFKLKGAL